VYVIIKKAKEGKLVAAGKRNLDANASITNITAEVKND
jgi:hypothetical protein